MSKKIVNHTDLDVYQQAFQMPMRIFALSRSFPKGGNLLTHRSDSPFLAFGMRKSCRSVAQAALRESVRQQAL